MECSGLASGSKKLHAKGQMFCVAEVENVVASELSRAILAFAWAWVALSSCNQYGL